MANRADFYVRNALTNDINVIRKLPDGSIDLETAVAYGDEEMIPLQGTEVSLIINGPDGTDIKECPVKVKSDVDLAVTCSRTDSNWALQIVPNELPPDTPTDVNVYVGEDGP
jgi:hypothetical protein